MRPLCLAALLLLASCLAAGGLRAEEYLTGIEWQEPTVVTPGAAIGQPPSDAVVLFDGEDLSAWQGAERWRVEAGAMVVGKGRIQTKQHFGDCQLHIEWSAPTPVKGKSQQRGNSGVFFCAAPGFGTRGYEVQVLDSYQNKTYFDGQAGAVYKQTPPMVNAMRPPGEWNTYDVFWTAPRFNDDESLKSPASMTVVHNGVLVVNHFELLGDTPYNRPPKYYPHPPAGPIALQDHGNPVRFRNIWVRELKPAVGERVREPFMRKDGKETPVGQTSQVTGTVTVDGGAIDGEIVLETADGKRIAGGALKDGKYKLDDVPAGDLKVRVLVNDKDSSDE